MTAGAPPGRLARLAARLDARLASRRPPGEAPTDRARGVRYLSLRAVTMRAREQGRGAGADTIILLPDPPNTIEHYDALVARLAPDHRVICLDLPGFGLSLPKPGFAYSMEETVAALAGALDALEVRAATLSVGCLGAFAGMVLARTRPDLVRRLVLVQLPSCDEALRWVRGGYWWLFGTPFLGQAVMAVATRRVTRAWYGSCLADASRADAYRAPAERVLDAGGAFCLASAFQQFRPDLQELGGIAQPAVVVWGGADRTHPDTDRASALVHLPDARLEVWPGCGHYPDLEDAARYADILRGG